jgi:hypothetical protein
MHACISCALVVHSQTHAHTHTNTPHAFARSHARTRQSLISVTVLICAGAASITGQYVVGEGDLIVTCKLVCKCGRAKEVTLTGAKRGNPRFYCGMGCTVHKNQVVATLDNCKSMEFIVKKNKVVVACGFTDFDAAWQALQAFL